MHFVSLIVDVWSLTVVYWIITLFSSSGLKSVFFCSVAKMCFICPTMQFSVLFRQKVCLGIVQRMLLLHQYHLLDEFTVTNAKTHIPVNPCVQFHFHLFDHLFLLVQALSQLW